MGRPAKNIQYLSSIPGGKSGIVFTRYIEEGRIKRKSVSWHPQGRTEKKALAELNIFLQSQQENSAR